MAVRPERASPPPRRAARDLIDAVVHAMHENLEELKFSTLAPSRYLVYVHPREYARLEGIIPHLQDEAIRALIGALEELNRRSTLRRYKEQLIGGQRPRVQNAGTGWQVDIVADPDESLAEGDILVESELLVPASPELGVGRETRRIATRHTSRTSESAAPARPAAAGARLVYQDREGFHTRDVTEDAVTIGRGGSAHPVDIRIVSSPDVSREHARIRRNPETGEFFLIDLSSLGTTLDGRHVPRGYDDDGGVKRLNGVETRLPDRARIGLAGAVFLDFQVTP